MLCEGNVDTFNQGTSTKRKTQHKHITYTKWEQKTKAINWNSCVKCRAKTKMALFFIRLIFETKAKYFSTTSMIKELKNYSEMTNASFFICLNSFESHFQHSCKLLSIITYAFFAATVKYVNQFHSLENSSMKNWNYS